MAAASKVALNRTACCIPPASSPDPHPPSSARLKAVIHLDISVSMATRLHQINTQTAAARDDAAGLATAAPQMRSAAAPRRPPPPRCVRRHRMRMRSAGPGCRGQEKSRPQGPAPAATSLPLVRRTGF